MTRKESENEIKKIRQRLEDIHMTIDSIVNNTHQMDMTKEQWKLIGIQHKKQDILKDRMFTLIEQQNEEDGICMFVR